MGGLFPEPGPFDESPAETIELAPDLPWELQDDGDSAREPKHRSQREDSIRLMSEPIERELTDHERATLRMAIDTMSIGGEQARVRGSACGRPSWSKSGLDRALGSNSQDVRWSSVLWVWPSKC